MKKIATLMILMVMVMGAVAQNPIDQDDCDGGLPEPWEFTDQIREGFQENLDNIIKDWKKIGATGHGPALTFKDIDEKRIVIAADYDLTDSMVARLEDQYDWVRVVTLFDATKRLSDIFSLVAHLGYDVVLHATLQPGGETKIFVYNYATLRHIMTLKSPISAYIYADVIAGRKRAPFEFEDSVMCTGMSYCNHLWTLTLHSSIAFEPDDDPYIAWAVHCSEIISNAEFMQYIGMDSTTARFNIVQDGAKDTFTFEYTPAQLLGEEPALDIDWLGDYLARGIDRTFPMPMQSSTGTMEHCSYDPTLRVLAIDCLMDEIDVVGNVGREEQLKLPILEALLAASEGNDFLQALAEVGLGLEYRIQSRTTHRPLTITFTPDELRVFMLERQ